MKKCLKAVIMVGGEGKRLRPFTHCIPKPLLPVGEKPILQITIEQLKQHGIREIYLVTCYGKELIKAYFQNGEKYGVTINYVHEVSPLGTAGGLHYIKGQMEKPFLVMNGDLLTTLNYTNLYRFHSENDADITVVTKKYDIQVPYGVVKMKGSDIKGIQEKPQFCHYINTGIYLLSERTLELIQDGRMDMTELITRCIKSGSKVMSYELLGDWVDIGEIEDYTHANEVAENIFTQGGV
jgi:NDP-sugar pyrophosphorylase family protein